MDKLENIFELQEQLNSRIGVNMNEMNDEERSKWILNYVRAMQQELAELTDSVPWKWWAKYQEFDKQNAKVEIGRFKGLGEMMPAQLKETTMNPNSRTLLKVTLPKRDVDEADQRRLVDELVNILMGKKPELRFKYIQENANLIDNFDI